MYFCNSRYATRICSYISEYRRDEITSCQDPCITVNTSLLYWLLFFVILFSVIEPQLCFWIWIKCFSDNKIWSNFLTQNMILNKYYHMWIHLNFYLIFIIIYIQDYCKQLCKNYIYNCLMQWHTKYILINRPCVAGAVL